MPKVPIDYSKTIMYKLVHKDDLDDVNVYVGHTTNYTERKREHIKNVVIYQVIKNIIIKISIYKRKWRMGRVGDVEN